MTRTTQHHAFEGMSLVIALAVGLVAAPALGCADNRALEDKAAEIERTECAAPFDEAGAQQLLKAAAVTALAPTYMPMFSSRLAGGVLVTGVRILMRPPPGLSPADVERLLQCHGARALLDHDERTEATDDPFWLPDDWVEIHVVETDGSYLVTASGTKVRDNLRVYARAKEFARAHAVPGDDPHASLSGYLNTTSDP